MSPTQVGIKLNDTTSASELDSFFTRVWSQNRRVKIVLDATDCRKISVGRILSMNCLLYTSPSPRDLSTSRMPSSA